jgi:hypothetical protein
MIYPTILPERGYMENDKRSSIRRADPLARIFVVLLLLSTLIGCKKNPCPKNDVGTSAQFLIFYLSMYREEIGMYVDSKATLDQTVDGITVLQKLVEKQAVPECLLNARAYLSDGIAITIDGLKYYQQNADIKYLEGRLADSITQIEKFSQEIETVQACAPNCSVTVTP